MYDVCYMIDILRRYRVAQSGGASASQLPTNSIFKSPSTRENASDRRENHHMGLKKLLADFCVFKC